MVVLLAFWQVSQPVMGATYTWNQTAAGTFSWVTTSNWTPTGFPDLLGDVANLNIDIAGNQTVNLDALITLGTLNIGDAVGTSTLTLAAGTNGYLLMDALTSPAAINKTAGGAVTISTGVQFNDTLALTNSTATTLTMSGTMRSLLADLTFNGSGAIAVSSVIAGGGGIIKNDAGSTTLSGANTYAGATTVNAGTLVLNGGTALPVRSAVTVVSGATLDVQQALTMGSLTGAGTLLNSSATDRVVTIGRDETSTTFTGRIAPATTSRVAITKIGAGTLTLASTVANTYTGATVINGGTLALDFSGSSLTSMLASTSTLTVAGGDLRLKGRSGASIDQTLSSGLAFTLGAGGGTIALEANGGTLTRLSLGSITSTAAGGSLLVNAPANTAVRFNHNLDSALSTNVNGRIVFTADGSNFNWAVNAGVNTDTVGLSTYLDVAGTTLATTNTSNSRIDSTTVGQSTSVAAGGSTTNSLKINAGATGQSLALGANNLTLTNGGLLFTGANDYSITGTTGSLRSALGANSDLVVHQYGTGNLTIAAILANGAGTSTLTKTGTGKLTLTGANSFTGAVFVNGGILSFSDVANGAGGLGAGVATAVSIRDGATLQYTGATGTIAAATSAGSHTFSLLGGNGRIEVTNALTSLTLSGVISGAGSLVKTGAGTLVVGAAATYTGSTYINEGTLAIGAADLLPTTPVVIASGATLDMSLGSDTVGSIAGAGTITAGTTTTGRTLTVGGDNTSTTFTGTFLGNATGHQLTKQGTGVLTLAMSTASAWTGNTNITGGVLRLGASNQLSTSTQVVIGTGSGPAVFDLNGFNQNISGGNAINFYGTGATTTSNAHLLLGAGTLTLGGNVVYNNTGNSGASTITSTGAGGIAMTSVRTFDIRDSSGVPNTEAELVVNANLSGTGGGITKSGAGNLSIIGGTNTTTGTNTFNSGITWLDYTQSNTAKLGTGALTMAGGTLVLLGNASAATAHAAASFNVNGGSSVITLTPGAGQDVLLNLGALARTAGTGGAIRFNLPTGTQTATNGFTTTTANDLLTGLLGIGGGFATVTDSAGVTQFATNVGGNVVGITPVAQDTVTSWLPGQHVTDVSGYSGTLGFATGIRSLRFNAASASTVTVSDGGVLTIASGGVLQTSAATGGVALITGGFLRSGTGNELIFTTDSLTQRAEVASTISGASIITKAGNGTLRLTSNGKYANDATGNVNLYSGLLQVSGGSAVGDLAAVAFSANKNAVFELLSNETVGAVSGGNNQASTLGSEIRLNGNTLTLNQQSAATYSGAITGTAASKIIKTGAGTWTYNANGTSALTAGVFAGTFQIDQGQVIFNGNVNQMPNVTAVILNGPTSVLQLNNDQTTAVGSRINDSASVTLNNTAGGLGLSMSRTGGASTGTETIASLTLGAGHNVLAADGTGTSRIGTLKFTNALTRNNLATALLVGRSLGLTAATQRGSIVFAVDPGGAVGGGGADAGTTISIYPYLIGESTAGAPTAANVGNSWVKLADTNTVGMRPLDLTTEYVVDQTAYDALGAGVLANNVRFTTTTSTLASDTTGVNSLILDSATGIVLTGPAQSLQITSGAIMAAGTGASEIKGYTGITTGATNPYYVYVTSPTGALTLTTPLTSTQDLVKSGAGSLVLGSSANAFVNLYLNQGIVQADALNKLGSGNLNFFGGTLKFAGVFDPSTKTMTFGTGGGTLDTGSNNITLANAIGGGGAGALTKVGSGTLTLQVAATYTGATTVGEGRLVVVGGGSNSLSTADLTLGSGVTSGVLQLGSAVEGSSSQTVSSLTTSGTGTANAIVGGSGATSFLIVNQGTTTTYAGSLGGTGTNENNLGLTKLGIGALTLSGTTLSLNGPLNVGAGTLNITGGSAGALAVSGISVAGGATLNLVNGLGQAINLGTGALNLGLGSGTTVLGLELGSLSAYDSITTTGAATTANNVYFNLTGLAGLTTGTYTLLSAASGLGGATYSIASFSNAQPGQSYALNVGATAVSLNSTALAAGDLYWLGGVNSSWLGFDANLNSNFTTDAAGTVNAKGTPGSGNRVIFSASPAASGQISTTLDGNFVIQDLHFTSSPAGVTSVAIAPGSVASNSLTITPSVNTDGIDVAANAGAVTISAPVVLGAAQTWNVSGTGASLTVTGAVSGGPGNSTQASPGQNVFLNITGGGVVSLGSTSNSFTGDIRVDASTYVVDSFSDWGNATVANTSSHSIILQNGAKLRVAATLNPGAITTTSYNLVQIGTGGATIETLAGATLQLDDAGQLYGSGALTKTGTGVLLLRNQGTSFTGTMTIAEGQLQFTGTGNFGSTTAGTTILSGATINVNGASSTDAEPLTINGNGLASLPAGVITNSSATAGTLGAVITLGSHSMIGTSSSGGLTLSGAIAGPYNLTVQSSGTGLVTLNGVIGADVGQVIQNSSTGALTLGGVANLWNGGLVIKAGTVTGGNNAGTFGASTNVITLGDTSGSANATLAAVSSLTYAQPINVVGGNTGVASIVAGTSTGNVIFSGAITLNNHDVTLSKTGTTGASQFTGGITGTGNVTINNAATTGTIALATGVVNPVGSVTHTSTATGATTISAVIGANVTGVRQSSTSSQLILTGENLYTALTTVDAGTVLSLGSGGTTGSILGDVLSNGTFTFNKSNSYSFAGSISGSGGINKLGAGTLTLSGSNSYTGTATVTAGALAGSISNGNLTLNGGVFEGSGSFTRSLGAGAGQVQWASGGNGGFSAQGGPLTVTFAGAPATLVWDSTVGFVSGAGQLLFGSTTTDNVVTLTHDIDFNGAMRTVQVADNTGSTGDKAVLSGVLSGSGSSGLTKSGAGILELAGANTYAGGTVLSAGTLQLNHASNGGLGGGVLTLTSGTLQVLVSGGVSISNNTLLTAVTLSGANSLTINGTLTGATGGSRTLTNSLSTGAVLTLGDVGINNDTTAARTLTIAGAGTTVLNGAITNGNGDAFANGLSVTNTGVTTLKGANSYSGTTTMNASAGVLVLSGSNSSSGATTLTTGTLQLDSATNGGLASGLVTLTAGTLQALNSARSFNNAVTLTAVTVSGSQNLTLTGKLTGATGGGRTLTSSIVGGTLTLGDVDLTNDTGATARTLTIAGTGNTTITGVIANGTGTTVAHNLSITNSATTTLSGANTYTGTTTINNNLGIVQLDLAGKLSAGNLTVTAGTLNVLSTGSNQSVALLTMGGGGAGTSANIDIGAGRTLAVTGGVTYTGTTSGTAVIDGAGTFDVGSNPTVTVADNAANAVDLSWAMDTLVGSGTLTKAGAGTLDIRSITNNNFSGSYQVNAGAILGLSGGVGNLVLNGGVFEGSGSFTRSLGTGAGQVQWLALGGGFSAQGADLTVTLSGAPDPLVWGSTPFFVPNGAPLIFGSLSANSAAIFTNNIDLNGAVRTLQAVDSAGTSDRGIINGVISGSSLSGLTKTGNGVVRLAGANTFTGSITVSQGTLEYTTASNNGGAASSLGQGTDGITLSGGTLSFVGDTLSQSTNRAISVTASSTLAANGSNGAVITYTGAITTGADISLNLSGTTNGVITGALTVSPPASGTATSDLNVLGGNWTLQGASGSIADDLVINAGTLTLDGSTVTIGDDIVLTGPTAVLNLNTTGVWLPTSAAGTSSGLYVRGGAVANLNANDVNGAANANGIDFILLADGTTSGVGTLNVNSFNITTPRLDVGAIADGYTGIVLGTGTITGTYTGTDYAQGFRFFRGSVAANLAGVTTLLKQGLWDFTLYGNNSGLTGTVAATRVDSGNLILDYSLDNNTKLSTGAALDLRGAQLTLLGGQLADTTQTVASLTLANGGANVIDVDSGGTFTTTLNVGAITRANAAGVIRFFTTALGSVLTTTTNHATTGLLGTTGTAYATVDDGTGTYFAINNGSGKIVPLTYAAAKNDVATWLAGDNITTSGTGLNGSVSGRVNINTLRLNAATESNLAVAANGVLTIASGGILQTSNVVSGTTGISGGVLVGGSGELVVTVDSATVPFKIASFISGATALTKTGLGTLQLSGTALYSGGTQLVNGVLEISGGQAIGDRSVVTLSDDRATTLKVLNDETIGGLAGGSNTTGLSTLALVDLGTNNLTLNVFTTASYSGLISGSSTIVKTGTSTQTLAGASSFSGALIVNQGQLTLGTRTVNNFASVGSVTLNGATLLLDFTGGAETSNKINNTAPVTMINTGGIDGLRANNDRNDGSKTETLGALTLLGGANTFTASANSSSGTTQRNMTIALTTLTRSNRSTLLVRGQNLGTLLTDVPLNPLHTGRVTVATAPTLTGAGGAVDTSSLSIVPWAIGANSITSTGTSFVTYGTNGFRVLDFTTEYEQLVAAGGVTVGNNVRFSTTADLTLDGTTARTMNSLLVDNTGAGLITLAGAGASLNVNSGAFLFTGAQPVAVSGFTGITTGALNEYIFHVVNTATAGVTVASPFTTTTAALTKSGAGTLILTATGSTYTGQTTINQGVLQIDALDKLGNNGSGGLLFNAGTLRFGAAFDVSTIPVVFGVADTSTVDVTAGGTFDTNGFDITVANAIGGGGNGGFTKTGTGSLTLNAVVNYGGGTSITGGSLVYGVPNALPTTMDLTLGAGTLALGANTGTLRSLTLTGAGSITGAAAFTLTGDFVNSGASNTLTINNSSPTLFAGGYMYLSESGTARTLTLSVTGTGKVTVASMIVDGPAAASNFTKSGSGVLEVTGTNIYNGTTTNSTGTLILSGSNLGTGGTTLTSGTLQLNSAANGGMASGALTLTAGTLLALNASRSITSNVLLATVTVAGDQNLTLNGNLTNNGVNGTLTNNLADGLLVTLAGPIYLSETSGTGRTLTVGGSGNSLINGVISNFNGVGTAGNFTAASTGTVTLNVANNYTGATNVNNGVLRLAVAQNMAGALQFGSSANTTTAGTLQVDESSVFASMLAQTNTALDTSVLSIASGKTLTINGNVVIGSGNASLTNTLFNATGAGSWIVNNTASGGTFRAGGSAANGNVTVADLSGLSTLTVSLNTTDGVFRVGSTSTTNASNTYSRLTLAQNNTITAATLAVGDGGQNNGSVGQINNLYLGSGTNVLNVNTINVGTTNRDAGAVSFAGTTGTLTVNNAAGSGRTTFNMGTGQGTGVINAEENVFDVTGHTANLLLGVVSIGTSNRGGNYSNRFSFDTGVLDMTSLTLATRTAESTNGAGQARNTTSVFNIGGGTVTLQNGVTSMATAAGAYGSNPLPQMTATINVSGGTVNVGATSGTSISMGNYTATGGTGTGAATATLNLTGGVTTLTGNIIKGGTSALINATVNLNGGTLDMGGKNIGAASTGAITFNAQSGTLKNLGELNGGGALTKTTAGTLTLEGTNTYTGKTLVNAGTLSISSESNLGTAPAVATADHLTLNGGTLRTTLTLALDDANRGITMGAAGGTFEVATGTTTTVANVITGTGSVTKEGAGTLVFTAVNTNSGVTTVNAGVLAGTGATGGNLVVNAGGTLAPGVTTGTLTVAGNLTLNSGSTLAAELGGATVNAATAVANEMAANGNLTAFIGNLPSSSWETYVNGTTAHDHLQVNGTAAVTVNGTVKISALLGGYTPVYGDVFDLLDWSFAGSMAGTPSFDFSSVSLTSGLGFNTDLFLSNGILVVVPEPSRMLLLLLGLLGVALRRRRGGNLSF